MLLNVEEVTKICKVKKGKAYEIMRQLNEEAKEQGYIVIRGRINSNYLYKRLGIDEKEDRDQCQSIKMVKNGE